MYSSISNIFLNNIKALKYYVDSVEPTMSNLLNEKVIDEDDDFIAAMIYMVTKSQADGVILSEEMRLSGNAPETAINCVKNFEDIVQEMEMDGKKIPDFLPKNIRKEYRDYEVKEKQKEILYRGSLLLVVTYFENLIASVMRVCFSKYPQRISLDEKSVSYKMLTEVNSVEDIKNILIDQEVTNKMYESLLDWKKYFQKNIKLNLRAWDENIEIVQEIIARRNLYVHNNGVINNIYANLVKGISKDLIGSDLSINRKYIDDAIDLIEYLGMALIIEIWITECVDDQEAVDNITDMIYEEYLEPGKWKVARHFYEICLQSPKILDADKILYKINNWQCYKWLGEYDKVKDEVNKLDVSAFKPKYILGIFALNDDFEKFFELYDNQTEIGEDELRGWPLFMELRKSEEYKQRFPEIEEKEVEEIKCKDTEDVTD